MNNKFCNRFYESRLSVNLKSKTCPELCRRIQNLKWLGLSVIACVFLVAAGVTEAQQTKKLPLIGYLGNRSPAEALGLDAFRQGLRDLGYTEGQNIAIEYRYFEGKLERLPELAAELVRLNCDVIVPAGVEAVEAAKSATKTVPIVMAFSGADPVRRGIITDLARPGGNITGLASVNAELALRVPLQN